MSEFKFMRTLSEAKSIFAIEQKAIASCFVENVACLLGHTVEFWSLRQHSWFQAPFIQNNYYFLLLPWLKIGDF